MATDRLSYNVFVLGELGRDKQVALCMQHIAALRKQGKIVYSSSIYPYPSDEICSMCLEDAETFLQEIE